MTTIPEDWAKQVAAGRMSGPPPHSPEDWLGEEVDRLAAELGSRFGGNERLLGELLGVSLAAGFRTLSNAELTAGYRLIEAGKAVWGVTTRVTDGSDLIYEWAGHTLLVLDLDSISPEFVDDEGELEEHELEELEL